MLRSQRTSWLIQRKVLGWLGILMPVLVAAGAQLAGPSPLKGSISAYWFSNVRDVFVGILSAFAVFLITYKGYDRHDNRVSNAAGICALLIALFPALAEGSGNKDWLFACLGPEVVSVVHYVSAVSFFLILAYMSAFLFTKTGKGLPSPRKRFRNKVYRICGAVILGAIVSIGLLFLFKPVKESLAWLRPVYFLELIALWAFGFSWLVKGETLWKDRRPSGRPNGARSAAGK